MSRTGEIYPLTAQYEVSESKRTLFDFFLSVEGMYTAYSHERYYVRPEELVDSKEDGQYYRKGYNEAFS